MPHSSPGSISVVIANWDGGGHIRRCLDTLDSQSLPPDEIVIVDNGSTDGSPGVIRKHYPHVRLLTRPRNEGFCRGYNLAIQASKSTFVLILNSDVFLDPGFLLNARDLMLSGPPRVGWLAANILHDQHPDTSGFVGQFLRRRIALVDSSSPESNEDVFTGSGSALFCRREMLADIAFNNEYYDEDFFAYFEDLDLAWRAQLLGWRCVYSAQLIARHIGSASQDGRVRIVDKSAEFISHIIKNRYLTLIKNATPGVFARFVTVFIAGECILWGRIVSADPAKGIALIRGLARMGRSLPSTLTKRRDLMRRRRVADRRILDLTRGI